MAKIEPSATVTTTADGTGVVYGTTATVGGDTAATESATEEREEQKPVEKTYTNAEVDEIVSRRLAREKAAWESKIAEERKAASEAEKLKGMNDLERATHERDTLAEENAELLKKINLQEQTEVARDALAEAGINFPAPLLKMFVSDDANDTKAAVDAIKSLFPQAVDAAVKDALKGMPPKSPNPNGAKKVSAGKAFAEKYNKQMQGGA